MAGVNQKPISGAFRSTNGGRRIVSIEPIPDIDLYRGLVGKNFIDQCWVTGCLGGESERQDPAGADLYAQGWLLRQYCQAEMGGMNQRCGVWLSICIYWCVRSQRASSSPGDEEKVERRGMETAPEGRSHDTITSLAVMTPEEYTDRFRL